MKKFTKSSLKCGDLIVYRCGAFEVIDEEKLSFIKERYDEELRQLDRRLDIMRVYRYPVWKREEPTITADEKIILRNVDSKYKYIARDNNAGLYVYCERPEKRYCYWWSSDSGNISSFGHLFKMVKWEDEEPWKIEDLLKLDVKKDGCK